MLFGVCAGAFRLYGSCNRVRVSGVFQRTWSTCSLLVRPEVALKRASLDLAHSGDQIFAFIFARSSHGIFPFLRAQKVMQKYVALNAARSEPQLESYHSLPEIFDSERYFESECLVESSLFS